MGAFPSLRTLTTLLAVRLDSSTRVGFTVNWLAAAGAANRIRKKVSR
jgi:hypothetical protein